MASLHIGNRPPKPYALIGSYGEFEIWMLSGEDEKWSQVKVVATAKKKKGNYWLKYSLEEQRFANGKDFLIMQEHQEDLATHLIEFMPIAFGNQQHLSETTHA